MSEPKCPTPDKTAWWSEHAAKRAATTGTSATAPRRPSRSGGPDAPHLTLTRNSTKPHLRHPRTEEPVTLLDAARTLHAAGHHVLPARTDGLKAPAVKWETYQHKQPDPIQITAWFDGDRFDGLGVLTGINGLVMVEAEGRAVQDGTFKKFATLMTDSGLGHILATLCSGWWEQTPSGGYHWYLRVVDEAGNAADPGANTKLARRPSTAEELEEWKAGETAKAEQIEQHSLRDQRLARIAATTAEQVPQVLFETRGTGGFTVTAPSGGRTHPTGKPWVLLAGQLGQPTVLSVEDYNALQVAMSSFDQMPTPNYSVPSTSTGGQAAPSGASEAERPGDDYNARASWDDILIPRGWTRGRVIGGSVTWTRPGKHPRDGVSATTGYTQATDGADRLYVFTTSTEFDTERPYDKFGAYAVLEHNGDLAAAAKALSAQGYGSRGQAPSALTLAGSVVTPAADPDPSTPTETTRPAKERLDVSNPAVMAEWLKQNVGTGPLSGLFYRGGQIVHAPGVDEQGYEPLSRDEHDDDGPTQIRSIDKSKLASYMQYVYDCQRYLKTEETWKPALFPVDAARVAVDNPDQLAGLRTLKGVTHVPLVRADGTIMSEPGYDKATGYLYLPTPGVEVPAIDTSKDGVAAAIALLDKVTSGFPFVTAHDRANYYGLLLTPLLRIMLRPPYKLGVINAPQPGSGKTLLAEIAKIIHGGLFRAELPDEDAELRKQITSILTVATGPLVYFDNVTGVLRSSTLAGLLTSASWGDRPLGSTGWVEVPNDRLWMITGNNVNLGGDLVRRSIWVNIDPHMPHPETRTGFAIQDPAAWVSAHRGELLGALLTLIAAWQQAGARKAEAKGSDGYATWIATVAGILDNAGVEGTFAHEETVTTTVGSDDDEWADFLACVHDCFKDQPWSVKELIGKVDATTRLEPWLERPDQPIKLSSLPADLADKAMRPAGLAGITRSMGQWLRNRQGRWAGDFTVRAAYVGHARETFWRIERSERHLRSVQNGELGELGELVSNPYAGDFSSSTGGSRENYTHGTETQSPNSPNSPEPVPPCSVCGRPNPDHATALYCHACLTRARTEAGSA